MKPKDFQIEWLTRLLTSGAGAAKSPTLLDMHPRTFPEGGNHRNGPSNGKFLPHKEKQLEHVRHKPNPTTTKWTLDAQRAQLVMKVTAGLSPSTATLSPFTF